jgi:hypothetical protein
MLAGLTPNGNTQNNNPQTKTANTGKTIQMFETVSVDASQDVNNANTLKITTDATAAAADILPATTTPDPQPCDGVTCSGHRGDS